MTQRILILCTGNSARSQMAEGLLRFLSRGSLEVHSAGTNPAGVNRFAIEAMREIGVDISGHRSKSVAEFAGQQFSAVITVCDSAAEPCPIFPGSPQRIHWSLPDPAAVTGSSEVKRAAFHRVRIQLESHLREFLSISHWLDAQLFSP
jgi:arsenate reductase (thioredoxin)